jgi:hypothetical protein
MVILDGAYRQRPVLPMPPLIVSDTFSFSPRIPPATPTFKKRFLL